MASIIVRRPATVEEYEKYYDLRYRIMRRPLGLPKGSELPDRLICEYSGYHLMAVDTRVGSVVGGVMGNIEHGRARVRFLCVEKEYRKQGVGRMLMEKLERKLLKSGARLCVLYARANVTTFYLKLGYRVVKELTKEEAFKLIGAPLPHTIMEKELAYVKL